MLRVVRANQTDLQEVKTRDERLLGLSLDCGTLDFCWQTSDHECHFRIFYRLDETEAEIVASRLDQFDYRLPSASDRIDWEDRFQEELSREDVTWHEVMSFIYSK